MSHPQCSVKREVLKPLRSAPFLPFSYWDIKPTSNNILKMNWPVAASVLEMAGGGGARVYVY